MKQLIATVLFALSTTTFAATLDGTTLNYQYYFPNSTSPYANADNGNKLVGAGVEVSNISDNRGTMDIFDNGFFIDYTSTSNWNPSTFNGFLLTDIFDQVADFTTFSYSLNTNMVGLSLANVVVNAESLGINWGGLSFNTSTYVELKMDRLNPVPLPAAVWLFGSALLGFVGWSRRKTKCV